MVAQERSTLGLSSRAAGGQSEAKPSSDRDMSLAELFAPAEVVRATQHQAATAHLSSTIRSAEPANVFGAGLRLAASVAAKGGVLVFLAWGLLFNLSEVRGSSMEPGIHDRDRILIDNVSYLVGDVHRGDVVVLRYPLDPSLDYIKRVVGLPGDEITIARGEVRVNGELLLEPYVDPSAIEPWTTLRTTVREGHYFVLGDNRRRSSDSREFGQVPFEYLRGKVRFRLWPMDRVGLVE